MFRKNNGHESSSGDTTLSTKNIALHFFTIQQSVKNNLVTSNQDQRLRSSIASYMDNLTKNWSCVFHSWVTMENLHTRERFSCFKSRASRSDGHKNQVLVLSRDCDLWSQSRLSTRTGFLCSSKRDARDLKYENLLRVWRFSIVTQLWKTQLRFLARASM